MALLPELRVRRELDLGVLVRVPLDLPGLRRPLSRVSAQAEQLSHAARAFLRVLDEAPA